MNNSRRGIPRKSGNERSAWYSSTQAEHDSQWAAIGFDCARRSAARRRRCASGCARPSVTKADVQG